MNETSPSQSAAAKTQCFAHWIVPGQTLMVRNRVLYVSNCQVVFHPEILSTETLQDVVEAVNFWYDKPVEGAATYYFNPNSRRFELAADEATQDPTQLAWVIQVTGKYARAIRRLYKHFHQSQK
ncbi:hypothetical protein ACQ4M3_07445 [Leptolyngbya sp. AN03gr2]|uniref:hypothetical protein n=1 Tax=unclassified Leptolyngbya TaxID=2650499 RepID=UPI003D3147EE